MVGQAAIVLVFRRQRGKLGRPVISSESTWQVGSPPISTGSATKDSMRFVRFILASNFLSLFFVRASIAGLPRILASMCFLLSSADRPTCGTALAKVKGTHGENLGSELTLGVNLE